MKEYEKKIEKAISDYREWFKSHPRPEIQPIPFEELLLGQCVKTKTNDILTVLEEHEDGYVTLAYVHPWISSATPWDIIVTVEGCQNGFAHIIQVWNRIVIPKKCLKCIIHIISDEMRHALAELYIEWLKKGAGDFSKYFAHVGSPMRGYSDWRHEHQAQSIEETQKILRKLEKYQKKLKKS